MKDRILEILKSTGFTATKLADELKIQRSGISHILSGRNQPSYDFIVKILNRFSEINAEWLVLGKGNMLKNLTEDDKQKNNSDSDTLKTKETKFIPDLFSNIESKIEKTSSVESSTNVTNVNLIDKIVLLNSNGTFKIYNQSK